MSAFLGPIHFWLYNKIQIQQDIVADIVARSQNFAPNLQAELDANYDCTDKKPLEEVIDQSNIHGWLQSRVTQAEYKLAYSITTLLVKKPKFLETIKEIFLERGRILSTTISGKNAAEAYKAISDSLLDGMPCDHANSVIEEGQEKVVWKRNNCVHKDYWEDVGGDISIYYSLRDVFIQGFLSGTSLVYKKLDELTQAIEGSEINE